MTIGGERHESYWATYEEALAEWNRLAPLAGHPGTATTPSTDRSLVSDREAAHFIHLRDRLAAAGLSVEEGLRLALTHKDERVTPKELPTAAAAIESYLASLKARHVQPSKKHVKSKKWSLELWCAAFGANRRLSTVRKGYEKEFAQWVNGLGHKPDTVLMIFSAVRSLLNYAVKEELLTRNPLTSRMSKEGYLPAPRTNQNHILTVPQASALLALFEFHYPSRLKNIAMQMFIGFRETQTNRMKDQFYRSHLKAFDLPPGIIRKARNGSSDDYIDQFPENFVEWIECQPANDPVPVAPGRKFKVEKGQWHPLGRCMWNRIMKRMGELPGPYRLIKTRPDQVPGFVRDPPVNHRKRSAECLVDR